MIELNFFCKPGMAKFIPRLNRICIAVRVVVFKLHIFCLQRPTRSEWCCSDIARIEEKTMIFDPLKLDGRADGNQKTEKLPLVLR